MKRTMIALAVLSSAATAAQAQSAITVYGVVDNYLARDSNGGPGALISMNSGSLNGSRLGFKGSEDLGGGLSAVFQIENGFYADTGALADSTRLFNRQSFVGLTGNFGAVKLGRQMNPVYKNSSTFDPFADALAGDSARLFSYNGSRTDNMITYAYDAPNGLRGELQYGMGEVAGSTSANRTLAGLAGYKQGPVDVVLTYQDINNLAGTNSTRMTLVGGNYDFGMIKTFATYAWEKGVVLGTATKLDQRDALVGVSAPVGASGLVMISYVLKTDKAVTSADARQAAIGYVYNLSKRTALYTSYGQLRNDSHASYKVLAAGATDKLLLAGIRHTF